MIQVHGDQTAKGVTGYFKRVGCYSKGSKEPVEAAKQVGEVT